MIAESTDLKPVDPSHPLLMQAFKSIYGIARSPGLAARDTLGSLSELTSLYTRSQDTRSSARVRGARHRRAPA